MVKGEMDVKLEDQVKQEMHEIIDTKDEELECFIERIDYSKRLPDFNLIPKEVIDCELSSNGIRINVKKG